MIRLVIFLLASACPYVFAGGIDGGDAPFHCYLTWEGDPTTSISVNFHTVEAHGTPDVRFDTSSHSGDPDLYPFNATATTHVIPGLNATPGAARFIHVSQLTGLTPGSVIYLIAGSADGGYTREYSVRLPANDSDGLRFVAGGDMGTGGAVPGLLQAAAAQSPHFAIIGGDLAYEDGNLANWALWDQWLTNWESSMVTPEGHSIPIIAAIGNHEVAGGFGQFDEPLQAAPFYFGLFAQSGRGFDEPRSAVFRRDFGSNVALLVLDTGHVTPIDGAQADWIDDQLANMGDTNLRLAAYHVPMYPSHRPFDEAPSVALRSAWLPLFDTWGLDVAFEHHDHMLKRTLPLRANAFDVNGTVYIGDGCLGQVPRTGDQAVALEDSGELASLGLQASYLDAWSPARHFWLGEVVRDQASGRYSLELTALDADANVLDDTEVEIDNRSSGHGTTCVVSLLFGPSTGTVPRVLSRVRAFRDDRMLRYCVTSSAADLYYRLSPDLSQWLSAHPRVLRISRSIVQ